MLAGWGPTSLILLELIVRIAVHPPLSTFGGGDHGMAGGAEVFRRVTVGRVVAAVRPAAFLAGPQVHPLAADLHAFLAFAFLWRLHRRDRGEVGTALICHTGLLLA